MTCIAHAFQVSAKLAEVVTLVNPVTTAHAILAMRSSPQIHSLDIGGKAASATESGTVCTEM